MQAAESVVGKGMDNGSPMEIASTIIASIPSCTRLIFKLTCNLATAHFSRKTSNAISPADIQVRGGRERI